MPLKPLQVLGKIPKSLRSVLNRTSIQKIIHMAKTKNNGHAITDVEKINGFCFMCGCKSKIQPKRI